MYISKLCSVLVVPTSLAVVLWISTYSDEVLGCENSHSHAVLVGTYQDICIHR